MMKNLNVIVLSLEHLMPNVKLAITMVITEISMIITEIRMVITEIISNV